MNFYIFANQSDKGQPIHHFFVHLGGLITVVTDLQPQAEDIILGKMYYNSYTASMLRGHQVVVNLTTVVNYSPLLKDVVDTLLENLKSASNNETLKMQRELIKKAFEEQKESDRWKEGKKYDD